MAGEPQLLLLLLLLSSHQRPSMRQQVNWPNTRSMSEQHHKQPAPLWPRTFLEVRVMRMRWMGAASASSTPGFWAGLIAVAICGARAGGSRAE